MAGADAVPGVSVIIPYYQGEEWLPISLPSVLAQQGVELEVIVADDGSDTPPDAIVSSCADARARVLRLPHSGKGAAVNAAASAARHELLCILDQDDRMLPGRLSAQAKVLHEHPEVDGVYSDYERCTRDGRRLDIFTSRQANAADMLHALATGRALFSLQTLLLRRREFDRIGGFCSDQRLTGLDDADFFVRLLVSGCRLRHHPGVVAQWTAHPSNYSKSEQFQDARLFFVERLSAMAATHPAVRGELRQFKVHHHTMRGIFWLETARPGRATRELRTAVRLRPASATSWYLLAKALAAMLGRGRWIPRRHRAG